MDEYAFGFKLKIDRVFAPGSGVKIARTDS